MIKKVISEELPLIEKKSVFEWRDRRREAINIMICIIVGSILGLLLYYESVKLEEFDSGLEERVIEWKPF